MDLKSKKLMRRKSKVDQIQQNPDGGWGWVVVITSIFGLSNWTIALRCYSVFYSDLIKDFNAEYSEVAILIGMFQAGYGISSIFCPSLVNYFSYRQLTMFSSILASCSVVFASFQQTLLMIHLFAGLIPGICIAPMILSCFTVVSRYFSKRRNLAIQLVCGGATVGGFVYSPLIQILIDNYTWRGALMIVGGIYLQFAVAGAAMKPIILKEDFDQQFLQLYESKTKEQNLMDLNNNCEVKEKRMKTNRSRSNSSYSINKSSKEPFNQICASNSSEKNLTENENVNKSTWSRRASVINKKLNLSVFSNLLFYLYTVSYSFYAAGYFSCMALLVSHGKTIGLKDIEASTLVSAIMVGELVSRLISSILLNDITNETRILCIAGYIGCLSFSFLFVYLSRAYYVMLLACSTIGIFGGSLDGVFSVFIGDTFGMKLYPAVFSYSATLIHVAGLGWSVIIGSIVDFTETTFASFIIAIVVVIIAAAITIVMRRVYIKKKNKNNLQHLTQC